MLGARGKQVCARLARWASAWRRSTRALDHTPMLSTPSASDQHHHPVRRLWWYVFLSRAALALTIGAIVVGLLGLLCVPNGFVGPKAASSLFAGLSANGAFVQWPRPLFEIGGLLALLSVALRLVVRVAFRASHD